MTTTEYLGLPIGYQTGDPLPHADVIALAEAAEASAAGFASVSVAGSADVTLTADKYAQPVLKLTGALTGDIDVIFPAQPRRWSVWNATTGAFSVTCRTAGAGVQVAQDAIAFLVGDGTDLLDGITQLTDGTFLDSLTINPTGGAGLTVLILNAYGSGAGDFPNLRGKRAEGTATAPTRLSSGKIVLQVEAEAYHDGSAFAAVAALRAEMLEHATNTARGGCWGVYAVPVGGTTLTRFGQLAQAWQFPGYTSANRDAISGAAAGDTVYNSSTGRLSVYDGNASEWFDPGFFTLTDAATVTVDVNKGETAEVVLGGNRTLAFSGTPRNGQKLLLRIRQDGTGSRLLTYPASVRYTTAVALAPTLSTGAGKLDRLLLEYDATDSKWDALAYTGAS